jgi:uncharacterized membrane protein YsdA (DUF1294 family)
MAAETFLVSYYLLINITLFLIMKLDKKRAQRNQYRISEKTLWILAIIGGGLGGTAGMRVFHHKTKHLSFAVGFPLLMVLQIMLLFFLLDNNFLSFTGV